MKIFELSKKKTKNGRRKFKMLLYQIFPDDCIDKENEVGTQYNANGITWIREYCEKALPSIKGMSLRCEFLDEERTELCGHGETGIVDGLPIFENAVVIGTFDDGYIDDVTLEDGSKITACIGVGTIDGCCYHNFCEKLESDMANGILPSGSIEIFNEGGIKYKYGYKDVGRIPMIFEHSGFALIGVKPADPIATILELNEKNIDKEEVVAMTELEIKNLIEKTVAEVSAHTAELNQCKDECDKKVAEANEKAATAESEKNEILASSEKIQMALDECRNELSESYKKIDALYEELKELQEALGKALAKERIGELNAAISAFTDEEKEYAKAEIDAFNADPVASEINSVVSKIYEGIGVQAKKDADAVISEQNSANATIEDIFSEVSIDAPGAEDTNIF